MDDDLNTADAIAALFELTKDINVLIASGGPSKGTCRAARTLFGELCGVLGLLYDRKEEELDAEIEALIAGPYRGTPKQELGRGGPDPGRTEGAENRAGGYPAGGQVA